MNGNETYCIDEISHQETNENSIFECRMATEYLK